MVTPNSRRTAPPWLRIAMLACVIIGIAAMHTLGHLQTHHAADHSVATQANVAEQTDDPEDHNQMPPLDPTTMCLAIGGSVATLLWVAAHALRGGFPLPTRTLPPSRWPTLTSGRDPAPPSLSALQVLRV